MARSICPSAPVKTTTAPAGLSVAIRDGTVEQHNMMIRR